MMKYWESFRAFNKKYANKMFWSAVIGIWIYNFYNWYQNPEETWARAQENLQNPYYYIPLGIFKKPD